MSSNRVEKERKRREKRKKRRKDRIHSSIAPMPPEFKKELLPYAVVKLLTGAEVFEQHKFKPDLYRLFWDNEEEVLHKEDFAIAKTVADQIYEQHIKAKNLLPSIRTQRVALHIHREAVLLIKRIVDGKVEDKKKLIFIKDQSGCGYWRMVIPARYMNLDEFYIDMAEIQVVYDYLLEYDVIVVQRLYSWSEYYTIERLKRQGKRIVYDIDDDIFHIPADNPAARMVKRDQYEAARGIMRIVDAVTTTTEILKERLGCPDYTIVIPNAIDVYDGYQGQFLGSPDEHQRILWMGSATHDADWLECAKAVDKIMQERPNLRMVILGFLPTVVRRFVERKEAGSWSGRVEFMEFKNVETYVQTTKQLRAECALAPLGDTPFNSAKSNIKWLEYTACGFPTVASNVSPYKEHIINGVNGFLANSQDEWYQAITACLNDPNICDQIVKSALQTVESQFDVKQVVHDWEKAILG